MASATIRFYVSGSVTFPATVNLIGSVVCNGTPACNCDLTEWVKDTKTTVPDKIGISI